MQATTLAALLVAAFAADPTPPGFFQIRVVDDQTNRGVPLIELRTVHDQKWYTDSAGVVAFNEPGLMDQDVFFHIRGHGYQLPPDGFRFHGRRLKTTPGSVATIRVQRVNIAERLYRITGAGIYAESRRLGLDTPIEQPVLNGQVLGSDSVQAAVFQDRIYWFWGDTNRASYPLGLFHAPGATSQLPQRGGLAPSVGVNLNYFVGPDGFAKATCQMPGDGPTWIDGLAVVTDANGDEHLFAHYVKVKPPLTVYRHGIAEFDPQQQEFKPRIDFPDKQLALPGGHSFLADSDGQKYVVFAKPFPVVRVPATVDAIADPNRYEAYTCLLAGSDESDLTVDRDEQGHLRYGWKRSALPMSVDLQGKLVAQKKLRADECLYRVRDVESGKKVAIHHGQVAWNEHRQRWLLIASEIYGTSLLGEVWLAEADSPHGPWAYARKIVTHEKQSFYNPRRHPFFDQENGRIVFFEGTYTHSFSGNDERTPRYEYNQIMYRLDLDDPRLNLPVAIHGDETATGETLHRGGSAGDGTFRGVRFFACERPLPNSVPFFAGAGQAAGRLSSKQIDGDQPLFYGLPPAVDPVPSGMVLLYELRNAAGEFRYRTSRDAVPGFTPSESPLCYVWPVGT